MWDSGRLCNLPENCVASLQTVTLFGAVFADLVDACLCSLCLLSQLRFGFMIDFGASCLSITVHSLRRVRWLSRAKQTESLLMDNQRHIRLLLLCFKAPCMLSPYCTCYLAFVYRHQQKRVCCMHGRSDLKLKPGLQTKHCHSPPSGCIAAARCASLAHMPASDLTLRTCDWSYASWQSWSMKLRAKQVRFESADVIIQ